MAHLGKYTKSGTGHLCKHFERAKDEKGNYIRFGNTEIDSSRTPLNYNLAPEHNQIEFIQNRLQEVKCLKRADVNVMCSWVVTAPKELPQSQNKAFFKAVYSFLEDKYGKENVISAYVHLDETTPHIHFAFIPVVKDKKKGIEKVSAKQLFNKSALQTFHPELQAHLDNLGFKVNVLNGATANGNRTITELKSQKAVKEHAYYTRKAEEKHLEYTSALKNRNALKMDVMRLEREETDLKCSIEQKKEELEQNTKVITDKTNVITDLENRITALQGDLNSLEVKKSTLESQNTILETDKKSLQMQINSLQNSVKELTVKKKKLWDWYNDNKPTIDKLKQLQNNLEQTIKEKCVPIINKFWSQCKIAIEYNENGQIEIAENTLKTATEETKKEIGISIPEPIKEPLKRSIDQKAEQTEQFIKHRRVHRR